MLIIIISSCQKEFIDEITTPGGGGSANGNLLVKGVSINGTDTTTINLKWDASQHLIRYSSSGKTNGVSTDSRTDLVRETNGNIKKLISIPPGAAGYIDSIISYPYYQPGTNKLLYVKETQYTFIGGIQDSVIFSYNSAGKISSKEIYGENFLTGVLQKQSKSTFTYDAAGNLVTMIYSIADALGNYSMSVTATYTYDSHKAPATLSEEAFLVTGIGEETVSVNNITKKVQQGSGTDITYDFSQQVFNSSDRTTSGIITITPVPPGYTVSYTYYYQ